MTVLLVILDPGTCLVHSTALSTSELTRRISAGDWNFAPWGDLWQPEKPKAISALDGMLVVSATLRPQSLPGQPERPGRVTLSAVQVQILEALMEGLTTNEIAIHLNMSERALARATGAIKRQLQSKTIAQTIGRAVALGYCRPRGRKP